MNIKLSNIDPAVSKEHLFDLVSDYCVIKSMVLISCKSISFEDQIAIIETFSEEDANTIYTYLKGDFVKGKPIKVEFLKDKIYD